MFQKKNVLFVLVIGLFVVAVSLVGFAQETGDTEGEEEVVSPDTTEPYIAASYQPVKLIKEFGKGIFGQCGRIVFQSDNKIAYVSDALERQVMAFSKEGELLFRFGGRRLDYRPAVGLSEEEAAMKRKEYENDSQDKIFALMDIGIDTRGNVYAADFEDNGVKVFTPEGKFVLLIPLQKDLQKKSPGVGATGVAINSQGDIYITDGANGRIQVNGSDGKYKYQITRFRDRNGMELAMNGPADPQINSFDELYVLDSLVCRVHRFSVDGNYLGSFGYMGDGAGGFNAPCGLAIDKLDRVYVCDIGFGVIQVFSREGKFLFALCDEKGKKLDIPFVNGIGVDSDNLVYVSINTIGGCRVRVFKYLTK